MHSAAKPDHTFPTTLPLLVIFFAFGWCTIYSDSFIGSLVPLFLAKSPSDMIHLLLVPVRFLPADLS